MSLKIWLPLNGSAINQGTAGFQPTTSIMLYTADGTGKIGSKAASGDITLSAEQTASIFNNNAITIAFWIYPLSETAGGIIFGNDGYDKQNNNRKFSLFQYYDPEVDANARGTSLHWSWMNDTASKPFTVGTIKNCLPINRWTHVCVTYQNPTLCIYIDGQQKEHITNKISNSSTFAYETKILHSSLVRRINDLRIYNHCLSPREVKLLAQGLVAHYKLDNNEQPNLINGGYGDKFKNNYLVHTYPFDYNGFGRYLDPATDDITLTVCFTPTSAFQSFMPHFCQGWCNLGYIYSDGTTNKQIQTLTKKAGDWNWVGDVAGNIIPPSTTPANADLQMYSTSSGSVNVTIHWVKLQIGDHPETTMWSPSLSENKNYYNAHDCSGYGNHGTVTAVLEASTDSPRYSYSTIFDNNKYIQVPARSYEGMKNTYTFSYWGKTDAIERSMAFVLNQSDGKHLNLYPKSKFNWNTFDDESNPFKDNNNNYIAYEPYEDGIWHCYTIVNDNDKAYLYLDGEYRGQAAGVSIANGTTLYLSGSPHGGDYAWQGNLSDFRLYATALSAAAVKELYQSSISFLDNGTLQCSEIVEKDTNIKYNQNGSVNANLLSEIGYTNKMKTKTLSDGSAWARIHWLDVNSNATYFKDEAEVKYCVNQSNRFSLMGYVDYFKSKDNKYEFILTYPALSSTGYNRWKQTSSPNESSVTGYEPVPGQISWSKHCAGLRAHNPGSCIYNCDTGGTWYAPIGQLGHGNWNGAGSMIPAADDSNTSSTELWVRIDNLPQLTKLSMFDDALQAHQIYEL